MAGRGVRALLVLCLCLPLAACSLPAPQQAPTSSTPNAAPQRQDQLARAQLESAYRRYLQVSDAVATDGGQRVERLKPYVTDGQYKRELATYKRVRTAGLHADGDSTLTRMALQRSSADDASAYVCLDLSDTKILDKSGKDVTPASRPMRITLQVEFRRSAKNLLIDNSRTWSGSSIC